jgi:hypothetical protein
LSTFWGTITAAGGGAGVGVEGDADSVVVGVIVMGGALTGVEIGFVVVGMATGTVTGETIFMGGACMASSVAMIAKMKMMQKSNAANR